MQLFNSQRRCLATIRQRKALTLVEMLVATVITLMLVYGLAQAFTVVSDTVTLSRSTLELAGQMRGVTLRLQQDLEGVTAPIRPWLDPPAGVGYFEYQEGPWHDGSGYPSNTAAGDADDVLMFTSRSTDVPFRGAYITWSGSTKQVNSAQSEVGEIAWWATWTDHDSSGILELNQRDDYTIYRRALLVLPALNSLSDASLGRYWRLLVYEDSASSTLQTSFTFPGDLAKFRTALKTFYAENDVSVRFVPKTGTGGALQFLVVANSLGDLTKRENRLAHRRYVSGTGPYSYTYGAYSFPYAIDRLGSSPTAIPTVRVPNAAYTEPGMIKEGLFRGEDVMLGQCLAFDVKAYDVLAPVGAYWGEDGKWGIANFDDDRNGTDDDATEAGAPGSDDEAVLPGDPGFCTPALSGVAGAVSVSSAGRFMMPIGRGAYVDLAYASKSHVPGGYTYNSLPSTYSSNFSGVQHSKSQLTVPTYDTWPLHYEYDGVNQDNDAYDGAADSSPPWEELIDEGTDGVDSPVPPSSFDAGASSPPSGHLPLQFANGVDDVSERETAPPYSRPLRGIQIRIRMIDHDTRQVRQATVVSDFTPE